MMELRITSTATFKELPNIAECLTVAKAEGAAGIVIVVEDGVSEVPDHAKLATLSTSERAELLHEEYCVRESLRRTALSIPVIVVATSWCLDGAAAGLAFAASHRVVTERTRIALSGCQLGSLPSGVALLGALAATGDGVVVSRCGYAVTMALALGAVGLEAHDAAHVDLAQYVPSADVPDLLAELRCAPAGFLDVPLLRRCQVPARAASSLFAEPVVEHVIESVFGSHCGSVTEVLASLEHEYATATRLAYSNSLHASECAEAVEDILGEAKKAMGVCAQHSPTSLEATFAVLRTCFADGQHEQARSTGDPAGTKSSSSGSRIIDCSGGGGIGGVGGAPDDAHAARGDKLVIQRAHQLEHDVTTELALTRRPHVASSCGRPWRPRVFYPWNLVPTHPLRPPA